MAVINAWHNFLPQEPLDHRVRSPSAVEAPDDGTEPAQLQRGDWVSAAVPV